MANRVLRFFFCKECNHQAELDELTSGVVKVECPHCEMAEIWNTDKTVPLDYFDHEDKRFAEC